MGHISVMLALVKTFAADPQQQRAASQLQTRHGGLLPPPCERLSRSPFHHADTLQPRMMKLVRCWQGRVRLCVTAIAFVVFTLLGSGSGGGAGGRGAQSPHQVMRALFVAAFVLTTRWLGRGKRAKGQCACRCIRGVHAAGRRRRRRRRRSWAQSPHQVLCALFVALHSC